MRKTILLFSLLAIAVLVGGCAHQANDQALDDPAAAIGIDDPAAAALGDDPAATAAVPAPGTEPGTVPEMIVEDGAEIDDPAAALEAEAPTAVESQLKEFNITVRQWSFSPSTITVNKGDTVKLTINSVDVKHGFSISEFGVNATINPGQETVVEFVADKTGTFTFFCSVLCGSGHSNLKGQLIVTE